MYRKKYLVEPAPLHITIKDINNNLGSPLRSQRPQITKLWSHRYVLGKWRWGGGGGVGVGKRGKEKEKKKKRIK